MQSRIGPYPRTCYDSEEIGPHPCGRILLYSFLLGLLTFERISLSPPGEDPPGEDYVRSGCAGAGYPEENRM